MSAPARARCAALLLLSALLAGTSALARAQAPVTGGTVPSTLSLSLGEPNGFMRTGSSREGNVYTTTVRAWVTATDAPARLSVVDGGVARPFRSWSEPVTDGAATVRLRRLAPDRGALRGDRNKLFLVTLSVGGP